MSIKAEGIIGGACRLFNMIDYKIKKIKQLKGIIADLKPQGKKIVFTNGCFDLLHYGHVKYLQEAKKKGDILIVGVNSDNSVKKIKGSKRPIIKEYDRIRTVAALESVDYAVLFAQDTPIKIIKLIAPDILVKGSDWNKANIAGGDFVLDRGGKVSMVKLLKGRSTTNLIKKIAKTF